MSFNRRVLAVCGHLKCLGAIWILIQLRSPLAVEGSEELVFKITDSPNPDGVPIGFYGDLNCSVLKGGPAQSIKWTKSGKELGASKNAFWSSLRLKNVSRENDGKYKCSVSKGKQQHEKYFVLHVFAAPSIKHHHDLLTHVSALSKTELRCEASGWPEPSLAWTKDGTKISATHVERTLVVVIKDKAHEGKYTCTATNRLGNDSYTTVVSVSGLPPSRPMITAVKPYAISARGENAMLRCTGVYDAQHLWQLIFLWELNGEELPLDGTKRITTETYETVGQSLKFNLSLTISNVSTSDAGIYDCRMVTTSSNAPSQEIQLILNQTDSHPIVSTGQSTIATDLNASVTLECSAVLPRLLHADYSWYFNDTPVQNSLRHSLHNRSLLLDNNVSISTRFALEFTGVTARDLGRYTCGVRSSFGWASARVVLRERQSPPVAGVRGKYVQLTISLATVAGLLLSLGAGWMLCRTMRKKQRKNITHFYCADLNNQEFRYDVFVSFSGDDFGWVNNNVTPLLEKHQLKYCIHNRDFELGRSIVDNMAESVYTSRKVLVVWSKNYMLSRFCREELQMAVQRNVVQGDGSLIVLRLDDVRVDVLPKSLRKRTYLDYSREDERGEWQTRLLKQLVCPEKSAIIAEQESVDSVPPLLKD